MYNIDILNVHLNNTQPSLYFRFNIPSCKLLLQKATSLYKPIQIFWSGYNKLLFYFALMCDMSVRLKNENDTENYFYLKKKKKSTQNNKGHNTLCFYLFENRTKLYYNLTKSNATLLSLKLLNTIHSTSLFHTQTWCLGNSQHKLISNTVFIPMTHENFLAHSAQINTKYTLFTYTEVSQLI